MKFIQDKIYGYQEIAGQVVQKALEASYHVIGITGTSSVGKSTFTKMIKKQLEEAGYQVQVIGVDDYLKEKYRAKTKFWNRLDSTYLKPEHFDWERLKREITTLQGGKCIRRPCYVRGIGWGTKVMIKPADYYIVEGLFLDAVQASEYMEYDLVISLTASDELVRELRTKRDAYYRSHYKDFKRTEEETQKEIEHTLMAGKSYTICYDKWRYLKLNAMGNFDATIEMIRE